MSAEDWADTAILITLILSVTTVLVVAMLKGWKPWQK